jgi:hypothetical protein
MTMQYRMLSTMAVMSLAFLANAAFADASKFPKDVSEFLANREACDHFRGEVIDPPDPELKKERNENIAIYCTGTDKQLARMKKKYAKRRDVMKELKVLDAKIEASR